MEIRYVMIIMNEWSDIMKSFGFLHIISFKTGIKHSMVPILLSSFRWYECQQPGCPFSI